MVKPIAICAAAFLLAGCNQPYPSKAQAGDACSEWRSGGTTVSARHLLFYETGYGSIELSSRYCDLETDTSQFLGYQISDKQLEKFKALDKSLQYTELRKKRPEGKIVKHFRF